MYFKIFKIFRIGYVSAINCEIFKVCEWLVTGACSFISFSAFLAILVGSASDESTVGTRVTVIPASVTQVPIADWLRQ